MSKSIAAELREAALGRAPKHPDGILWWCGWDAMVFVVDHIRFLDDVPGWVTGMTNDERRMFLLFCSYAAEDEE